MERRDHLVQLAEQNAIVPESDAGEDDIVFLLALTGACHDQNDWPCHVGGRSIRCPMERLNSCGACISTWAKRESERDGERDSALRRNA